VEHSGSSGGYRTIISRFPSAHTSVAALCNISDANPTALGHQVADIVLGSKLQVPMASNRPSARPDSATVGVTRGPWDASRTAPFVGRYYSPELDATYEITVKGQALTVRRPRGEVDTLQVVDPSAGTFRGGGLTYHFAPNASGASPSFTVDIGRARGMLFNREPSNR
jgi:hypothetical protein